MNYSEQQTFDYLLQEMSSRGFSDISAQTKSRLRSLVCMGGFNEIKALQTLYQSVSAQDFLSQAIAEVYAARELMGTVIRKEHA